MFPLNKPHKIFLSSIIVATVLLMAAPLTASAAGNGFRSLQGQAARNFSVPADVRLVRQREMPAYGLSAERFQQYFGDAEVLGGQITVYRDADGNVQNVIGAHYSDLQPSNSIVLAPGQARQAVARELGEEGRWLTTLMFDPESGRYYYEVENQSATSRWFHWIDAENGSVINAYDGLTHSSGVGVNGETKDLTGLTSGNFKLESTDGRQTTYDARNRNRLPGILATDDDDIWDTSGSSSPGQPALVDAQFYANVTDDYYLSTHSFNWTTYYPQGMVSSAHVQRKYNNAYWNGSQMAYGDGDGTNFIELSGDLDVVGHELSHGVTEATSNLIYQNESGALNEAFSDIMGTAIEYYNNSGNWTIGEDVTPGDNGIRNMADPGEDGDPSHYDERYTGTGDNGGVHINSGIANHWFYLLVNGGQNADSTYASGTDVQGIGMTAAEGIAFLGFTALTANADFCDARASTISIAGGNSANVANAWDEVGVDDALCSGTGGGTGGTGGGDNTAPVISNVRSESKRGTKFQIKWDTDEAATTEVVFTCCGSYSDPALVSNHSMQFNGQKNVSYEYYVSSTDADGNTTTDGPHTHQN